MKITDDHERIYDEMMEEMINKAVDNDSNGCCVFLALGLKMYRSCLDKEDFQRLMNDVCSSAVDIEPFVKEKKESVH